jgi:hypothetical protein
MVSESLKLIAGYASSERKRGSAQRRCFNWLFQGVNIFRLTRSARRFITKKIHYNEPIRQHAPVWGRPENHLGTAISAAEAGKAWNHGVNNSGSTLKNAPGAAAV